MTLTLRTTGNLMETLHTDRSSEAEPMGAAPDQKATCLVNDHAGVLRGQWPPQDLQRERLGAGGPRPRTAKLPPSATQTGAAKLQKPAGLVPAGLVNAMEAADHPGNHPGNHLCRTELLGANLAALQRVELRPPACVSLGLAPSPLAAHPGGAPAQGQGDSAEGPATAESAGAESLARPERIACWRRSLEEYKAIASAACDAASGDAAPLSPSEGRLLAEVQRAIAELEAMLPSLEGREMLPAGDTVIQRMRLVVTYAQKDVDLRRLARDLTLLRPGVVTHRLKAFGHLSSAAAGMRSSMARDARQFGHKAPEVVDYLRQVDRALETASSRAISQGRVQVDILGTLRDAVQGYADADLEDRRSGIRDKVARLFGLHPEAPADAIGQIHQELQQSFGDWFHIERVNEHRLSVSLQPDVVGRQSCADLLRSLAEMTSTLCTQRDRHAVRAAIAASPDVEWVRDSRGERLELTPAALRRMAAGGSATLDAVPGKALRDTVLNGAECINVAVLKFSLMESFRGSVDRIAERARNPFNLQAGLTQAKAQLMQGLLQDLMSSPHVDDMLRLLDLAVERHRSLWRLQWGASSGGTTQVLLDDMRGCVQRFAQSA